MPAHSAAANAEKWPPLIRHVGSGFEVWANEYVRNESRTASPGGYLRRLITDEVRALPKAADRVPYAAYAGQRWQGTDVENLLFNNIDQTLSLFSAPGRQGIRFEDLGPIGPAAPDGTHWRSFYRYHLAEPGQPFATAQAMQLICRTHEATVPDGPARLAARIWLAVRRARWQRGLGAPLKDGNFLLRVAVRGMDPAASLKAIVDGATAAMQCDDPDRVRDAVLRLSALIDVNTEELLALASTRDAPLGPRSRSSPTSKESLFTLDGAAQVRVTPDDHRCVAAEVLARDTTARQVTVEVYAVKR